jgi:hypothetical protein
MNPDFDLAPTAAAHGRCWILPHEGRLNAVH